MADTLLILVLILFFLKGCWAGDRLEFSLWLLWLGVFPLAALLAPALAVREGLSGLPAQLGRTTAFALTAGVLATVGLLLIVPWRAKGRGPTLPLPILLAGSFSLLRGVLLLVCLASALKQLPLQSAALESSRLLAFFACDPG